MEERFGFILEKKLTNILKALGIETADERIVLGISDDSREVKSDWIFVCRKKNGKYQGKYINDVLKKGAVVLCDNDLSVKSKNIYKIKNIELEIPKILKIFYGDITKNLIVIGITGTNGKSSVSGYITQILRSSSKKVLRIGTHIVEDEKNNYKIRNTTPDCFQLIQYFQMAVEENILYIVMEVSSHAISQHRICFVRFDYVIYTNIDSDHIDYHKTRIQYAFTKLKLMNSIKKGGCGIINIDDGILCNINYFYPNKFITVGMSDSHFKIHDIDLTDHSVSFYINDSYFYAPLLGMFNVYNLAQAICISYLLKIPMKKIQQNVKKVLAMSGRMEIMKGNGFYVWIDYAHTAEALKKVLLFANNINNNNIYVIVGCGGNRDRRKRKEIADIACKLSTKAIFTTDNPRYEEPYKIIYDLCETSYKNYEVFENRRFAIKYTIKIAEESDIIIIAGKGDEDTQEINGDFYHFHDGEWVRSYLKREG